MRSRVIPGSLVTMERRVPVKRLNSVDLPTLGRPTITKDGSRVVMNLFCVAIFQFTSSLRAAVTGSRCREFIKSYVISPFLDEPVTRPLGEENGIVTSTYIRTSPFQL